MRSLSIPWVSKPALISAPVSNSGGLEVPEIASSAKINASSTSQPGLVDQLRRSETLDPDIRSYFFVRQKSKKGSGDSGSTAVSPRFGNGGSWTSRKFSKSHKSGGSRTSGDSNRSTLEGLESLESSVSVASKYRPDVRDWNEKSYSDPAFNLSKSQKRHPLDPPRPAREGMEWVWFPEGYWAEREIRDLSLTPQKEPNTRKLFNRSPDQKTTPSPSKSLFSSTPPKLIIPRIEIGSLKSYRTSSKGSFRETKNDSPDEGEPDAKRPSHSSSTLPPLVEKLGLYCRAKRRFGKKTKIPFDDAATTSGHSVASRTAVLLEGTSSYFDRLQNERSQRHNTLLKPIPVTLTPRPRRTYGLAPWHRKQSHESILSVSSSVHKLLIGKTPAPTPRQEAIKYTDQKGRQYSKVEILGPNAPATFLPSEATRIDTPPMSPGNPTSNHARGFFFDLSPAIDEPKPDGEKSAPTSASQSLPTSAGSYSVSKHKSGGHAQGIRDWWEANTKHSNVGGKSTAAEKWALKTTKSQFELNMVEHLPNSPLCPKNPKHKSGGTGICVYHGRNGKSRTAERATTSATEESVSYP